ncbi:hypothetical protein CBR_g11921 [Chara braunii]|uniref:Integrase catalytic domain-containing protein n=1 Tax=Chara braunii TaxID=69332 RepID=A0A388KQY5_CHABU|nr:hypothetical protein CBR_g11921 [Chara braunii]|eukprot:GBG72343.1 hypothetical protein CBR_g11921 [Chara braunii]
MVETRSGIDTSPYTKEQQEKMAALVKENRERKEHEKQAKLKTITEEQAAKMKELEEEMEKKKKAAEEEAAEEEEKERMRIESREGSSGTKRDTNAEMEKKISEWVANLSLGEDEEAKSYVTQDEREALANELAAMGDPMERREREEEQKLAWKLRMKREKKRRREEVNKLTAEVAKVQECRKEVLAQTDDKAKWDKVLGYLEVLSKAWMEERRASWSQEVALSAMRSGFRDFARDMITHIGGEVKQLRDNVGKFSEGTIEGAKAIAAVEGEARPRKEPVKLKFPDAYGGKKEENFDNWEASVNSYIYLQHILIEEQVLVAFQALKDETTSFARSLARAAGCENNLVAYSKVTPLSQFLKLLKERFTDPTRGVRASDKLQTIHSRQWRSARALKGTMDNLVAVPNHGVIEPQLVQLFYRAMPEALRGHYFDKSQQDGITYDALSREVVLYESRSMPVTTFWHKDLDKGKRWKGRTISGQVLEKLREANFKINAKKCEWAKTQVLYLGHVLDGDGIKPENSKIAAIRDWLTPRTLTELRSFLGLANYYGKFVRNFSTIAAPLHRLLKKEAIWQWDKDCTFALKRLERALIEYSVLKVADPSLPFVVTTDASQYGIGAVLQQDDDNGYRPVEFMSARMPSEKAATSMYEREFYALSDRDSCFTRQNWQELMRVYGSKLLMSSGRHPETNGQTKQMNKILQQVLRTYIRPDQIKWDEMLPKVASAYNNNVHLSTCRTPNELHKFFRPRRPFEGLNRDQIHRLPPGTREFVIQHEKELATVVENLRKAQHRMIEQANKHRRPSQFQVGDLVWVKAKEFAPEENISQKLLPAYRGPWSVLEVRGGEDGPSYTIEIPAHLHTYLVFHASKLLSCATSQQFPSRRSVIPPDMDGSYDIDGIVDEDAFRTGGRGRPQKQYKVRFAYQEPEDDRWLTRTELLETAPDIVRAYERDKKGKGPALD